MNVWAKKPSNTATRLLTKYVHQQIVFIHHHIFLLFFTEYYINAQAVNKLTGLNMGSQRANKVKCTRAVVKQPACRQKFKQTISQQNLE